MAGTQYADAKYGLEQTLDLGVLTPTVNGAALEELARFRFFTAVKVKEVRAMVAVAGKGDTSGFQVGGLISGTATASIGTVLTGTATAKSAVDASLVDKNFAATDELYIQNIVATDVNSARITIQFQERFTI